MKKLKLNVLCFFVSKTLKKVYTQLRCNNYVFFSLGLYYDGLNWIHMDQCV